MLLCITLFSGCTSAPSNPNLRPSERTNEVALTNLNLAIEYMRTGNMEIAMERLNRAYEADPRFYGTHNAYGLLYQRLGDNRLAERHFKRAIALNSNDSASKNNYGNFLCSQGRYDAAESIFISAAQNPLYESPEIAYANAGTCAMANNRPDAAENHFRQALNINSGVPSALLQMAQLNFDKKNYLPARGYLQRFQSVARHNASSLLLGIKIERILGDKNAVSSYEMALENNYPDSVQVQEMNDLNNL
jgi:type IV pilus assembly protein PilF